MIFQRILRQWLYVLLPFIFILSSCKDKSRIEDNTMVKIYTDLLVAQDTTFFTPAGLDSLLDAVFKKYNVDAERYEATLDYYNEDSKRWEQFFDRVIAYIDTSLSKNSK
jgi:hypothetical protein